MRFSRLLTVSAALYLVVGGAFALWPYHTMGLFGVDPMTPLLGLDPDPARRIPVWTLFGFTRLYGTALLGAGVLGLLLRRTVDPDVQRDVVTGLFLFNLLACAMTALQQLAVFSLHGQAGWWLAAAFGCLAGGFGHLLFSTRGVAPAGVGVWSGLTLGEVREGWLREVREAAAQQERSRLARDLHDSIKQQLFTISVSAAAVEARLDADAAGARSALAEVRQAAHEGMVEMEAMLQHLQPVALATVGLVEALRQQCEATKYRTGAEVTLEAGELPDEDSLPPGTHASLFRIAQEALSNIGRHARARRVDVRLERGPSNSLWAVQLVIVDDGSGFDPVAVRSGMGLANLRARAGELGAELGIESAPGQGTRVFVRVPAGAVRTTAVSAGLQRGLLLGLAAVFHLGLVGRPVLGGWLFWATLPLSAAAVWLSARGFRMARRGLSDMVLRLGGTADEVLRLRRERAQALFLLVITVVAWNPVFSVATLSYFGLCRNGVPAPGPLWVLLPAVTVAMLVSIAPFHRALAALCARLGAAQLRAELGRALEQSMLPVVVQLGTVGLFGRFLHEPMIVLLPAGLAIWLGSLAYWALHGRGAERPGAEAVRG